MQSLTQDAILVYRVLTNKACTKDLYRSLVATHTSTNFWVRLQTNGTPVQALHIPLLYVNSFHFWPFMLEHPAGGGQRTKRAMGSSLVTQTASGKESSGKISGEGSSQVPQAGSSNGSSCKFSGKGSSRSVPMSGVQHPATSSGHSNQQFRVVQVLFNKQQQPGVQVRCNKGRLLLVLPRLI